MKIQVLLSAYNGETFLREQLDSLLAQTGIETGILVRDDGSSDGTAAILEEYAARGALRWYRGENRGPSGSFWQLLRDAEEADLYAFCDQDDVWDADKLRIAADVLERAEPGIPALYCGDVRVTDERLGVIAPRMLGPASADYPHALVKNIAPGCTFVFNRAALELLRRYDDTALGLEFHDWTAYQIIACFGYVFFDPEPHMSYRQHAGNAIGAVRDPAREFLRKARSFWGGKKRGSRQRGALRLERAFGAEMTEENRELTADFAHYREEPRRRRRLLRRKEFRTPLRDGLLLRILVLFGKL